MQHRGVIYIRGDLHRKEGEGQEKEKRRVLGCSWSGLGLFGKWVGWSAGQSGVMEYRFWLLREIRFVRVASWMRDLAVRLETPERAEICATRASWDIGPCSERAAMSSVEPRKADREASKATSGSGAKKK